MIYFVLFIMCFFSLYNDKGKHEYEYSLSTSLKVLPSLPELWIGVVFPFLELSPME